MKLQPNEIRQLAKAFIPDGLADEPRPFGGGHINDTYMLQTAADGKLVVMQRINQNAFPHPDEVMDNMVRVTDHLRRRILARGGDPERETLRLLRAPDGLPYVLDRNGDYWRAYFYVDDTVSYDRSDNAAIFCETGRAFGRFMCMLDDFDAQSLYETIPHFHDTPARFRAFREAVERDAAGRADGVRDLIKQALRYEPYAATLTDALAQNKLPVRVTHNDTKLNNALLDSRTGKAICVIDLDTVMPGLAAYDFGDAIRYGASTAAEDECDLSLVHLSMPLYRAYAQGYLSEAGHSLSEAEVESLPAGAKLMTLECLVRFLGDYLNGDVYFKTAYPQHNLVRARTQLKLVEEMDAHWDEMLACVYEHSRRKG